MRFIDELLKPGKKCKRVGHKTKEIIRHTYRKPYMVDNDDVFNRRYSVFQCKETRLRCTRCKSHLSEWLIVSKRGYTGYSMPSRMADELREHGVVEF